MKKSLLMTAAMAALIGTTGIAASQQSPGAGGAANAPAASQSAPSGGAGMGGNAGPNSGSEKAAPMNRGEPSGAMKGGQAQMPREGGNQHAQDQKAMDHKGKAASDSSMERSKDGTKADQKNAAEGKKGTTTGQAGAGAKLSGEQRTSIRTSITKQNIKPVTNINFSISIGTHVPRTVAFHPLPAEVVTIYPDWRGYEFFLVNDQIVVVNPRTLEIVAVLDA
ncbi:MAG: hypothetical protein BGN84_16860 [Afipia sp. 62-7]|nr:DUF1236 domain-containing protein [Afipia sp.]OJU20261.1 MAG: hypothetical protein BGN84_16860 [Afipia sp. 62-7]